MSHELRPFTTRTRTDPEVLEVELGAVGNGTVCEHGEFRDGVSCTASLVPRRTEADPAWAVVVAVRDEDVPAHVATEVRLAAADLAGSATA
jgi:DNA-binding IclR family transcriptional regulator